MKAKELKLNDVRQAAMTLLAVIMLAMTAQTARATDISDITVNGVKYSLLSGFSATSGNGIWTTSWWALVDGKNETLWQADGLRFEDDLYEVQFHVEGDIAAIVPKGYILYTADNYTPTDFSLSARLGESGDWTVPSSCQNEYIKRNSERGYGCYNPDDSAFKYFLFSAKRRYIGMNYFDLRELKIYGLYFRYIPQRAATCTKTGIKLDCYLRSDGKYYSSLSGGTELSESDVIAPIHHSCKHCDATDANIEYWRCTICGKYFSDADGTTEITEEDTKIYYNIKIGDNVSGLINCAGKAVAGSKAVLVLSHLVEASTLKVDDGKIATTDMGDRQYTFTMPLADVTVTADLLPTYSLTLPEHIVIVGASTGADSNGKYISETVVKFKAEYPFEVSNVSDGTNTLTAIVGIYSITIGEADVVITADLGELKEIDLSTITENLNAYDSFVLKGSTNRTVTIADGASITLSDATIKGGVVCAGSATINLVGKNIVSVPTNSYSNSYGQAGIQIGPENTTLTIKGNGELSIDLSNINGGGAAIGTRCTHHHNEKNESVYSDQTGGNIVIESGTIFAKGSKESGAGIGTGCAEPSNATIGYSQTIGDIIIKGGSVTARNTEKGHAIGKGAANNKYCSCNIGKIVICDFIDLVDASNISEAITYMDIETGTDVSANANDYFSFDDNDNGYLIVRSKQYTYTFVTARPVTCTEKGINMDCYQRNDGNYYSLDGQPLSEADVYEPVIPHPCIHHEATDFNIVYWQCPMCGMLFGDDGFTMEITEEDTKIYRRITIDGGLGGVISSDVSKAMTGTTVTLFLSDIVDTSTLKVNDGTVTTTEVGSNQYTFTVPAVDVTITASILPLTDDAAYKLTSDADVPTITYKKTLGTDCAGKPLAWLVPFDYTILAADQEKFSFYKINMIANSSSPSVEASDEIWVFLEHLDAGTVLRANLPYIYVPLQAVTDYEFTTENTTLMAKNTGVIAETQTMEDIYSFYAIYEDTTPEAGVPFYYIGSNSSLDLSDDGTVTVGPYRWIMRKTSKYGSSSNYARQIHFVINKDYGLTGIKNVDGGNADPSASTVYTLDGRRLSGMPTQRGVYIVEGRKAIIK